MTTRPLRKKAQRFYSLALGAYAVGAERFMIAGTLPRLAADLSVGPGAAGYLVTALSFAYTISSPILSALTGRFSRQTVRSGSSPRAERTTLQQPTVRPIHGRSFTS